MADGARPPLTAQVKTACPYCGVGCGVLGAPGPDRTLRIAGDTTHPANIGRLCSKGTALGDTVGLEGRLLAPEYNGRRVSWPKAVQLLADRFQETIIKHGPDSVAFYVSGQLLTEDYHAANKLMKGYIGSANIDTNSRLCMASAVAAHKQAFGADLVPGCYEDLELASLITFAGHNAAWTHPVLFRRMEAARAKRGQAWVVIDPRRTDTAAASDLHLPLKPQTDVRLWNGLFAWLDERKLLDQRFLTRHTQGLEGVRAAIRADDQSLEAIARDCDVPVPDLARFYQLFAAHARAVTLFSMGLNQSAQGVAKGLAVINVHLATGKIGKPGAAPFSITGQPNAMGGRETGGLANTLAAHMDFDPASRDRVQRFWQSPTIASKPGLKAVDMFDAVADGRIKAIWIMATNPVVSMPNADHVARALANCPFVAVSEVMNNTDTLKYAHLKLPALAWGEKDGTVTNSERRISRQRALFKPPGQARADWRIIRDVAHAMGHGTGFDWQRPADVFRDYAALTCFENNGTRWLDLGPLADLSNQSYQRLRPVQWPVRASGTGLKRLFVNGNFQTESKRANLVPVVPRAASNDISIPFPLRLNSARVRDHWHTMTRTGLAAQLCQHEPEPVLDMHPTDAAHRGLGEGQLVEICSAWGKAVMPVRISDRQRPGCVHAPMHWPALYASHGRSNAMINPATDPTSGQPEFKHTPVEVAAFAAAWQGFAIARTPLTVPSHADLIWRVIPKQGCVLHEFAVRSGAPESLRADLLAALPEGMPLSLDDPALGLTRHAVLTDDRLDAVLFLGPMRAKLPRRDWLIACFGEDILSAEARAALLVGRNPGVVMDTSAVVCACRTVRESKIVAAIENGADTLDKVATETGAGATCGSCRPQVAGLIKLHTPDTGLRALAAE